MTRGKKKFYKQLRVLLKDTHLWDKVEGDDKIFYYNGISFTVMWEYERKSIRVKKVRADSHLILYVFSGRTFKFDDRKSGHFFTKVLNKFEKREKDMDTVWEERIEEINSAMPVRDRRRWLKRI